MSVWQFLSCCRERVATFDWTTRLSKVSSSMLDFSLWTSLSIMGPISATKNWRSPHEYALGYNFLVFKTWMCSSFYRDIHDWSLHGSSGLAPMCPPPFRVTRVSLMGVPSHWRWHVKLSPRSCTVVISFVSFCSAWLCVSLFSHSLIHIHSIFPSSLTFPFQLTYTTTCSHQTSPAFAIGSTTSLSTSSLPLPTRPSILP